MERLKKITVNRLLKRGIESKRIKAYIRDLINTSNSNSNLTVQELNTRMNHLGWGDVELDDHTLQLITAVLETGEGFNE